MDAIQDILLLILTIGGIVLAIVLISSILRINRLIDQIRGDIQRISDEAIPTLRQSREVAARTEDALSVITDNRPAITSAVENVRKVTENIYRLEQILQEQVEPSVVGLAHRLSGLRKGIDSFITTWRQKH
jgi:uncharacterized protein YoxC